MKRDQIYLKHILDAIAKINEYVSVGQVEFMSNSHWQDAVIRQLEIIGEATKRISSELRRPILGSSLAAHCRVARCSYPRLYGC